MKRKLLLLLLAFISLGCFADSQPTDAQRRDNLFVYNGMLFSIQKFVSTTSQDNAVEFCGWTTLTDLSTDAKKDEALADAQKNAIRKVGEITIPETVTAGVTYNGVLQGNATYKVTMLRANLFRAALAVITAVKATELCPLFPFAIYAFSPVAALKSTSKGREKVAYLLFC